MVGLGFGAKSRVDTAGRKGEGARAGCTAADHSILSAGQGALGERIRIHIEATLKSTPGPAQWED